MKLQRWALVAEIVGAVAVVVSVLYVGFQVRQNSAALEAVSVQSVTDSISEFALALAGDEALARIYETGLVEGESGLEPDEWRQFRFLMISVVRRFENMFFQHQTGAIPDGQWLGLSKTFDFIACTKGAQEWWEGARGSYSMRFVSFIEEEASHCG